MGDFQTLQEHLQGGNGFECIQRRLDRGQRIFGPGVCRRDGGYEAVDAVGVLGDGERGAKWAGLGPRDVLRRPWMGLHINVHRGYCRTGWVLKRLEKAEGGCLRSLELHARHLLPGFEHLEVQSIIVLRNSED